MSILNVNQIQPVGSGQTITVSATDITASSSTISANSFSGNVTGNINATGISTFNVITGVSTIGVTTIHVTGINDLTYPTAGPLSNRNLVINGAMQVAQRGTSFAVTDNTPYTLDRWQASQSSAYNWGSTITQSTEAPDGFGYSLKVDVTTVNAFGSSDSAMLRTKIEGQDLQQLAFGTSSAKPITLSFWVRSNKLGTYSVQIICLDAQRHCVVDYTIDNADVWEYKTITLPGQTSETIANNNSIGMEIRFSLGADAGDQVAPNSTWVDYSSTALRSSTNQINFFDSTSNEWYLTGVQLEVGTNATEFEHRSYGKELVRCQRYYVAIGPQGNNDYVNEIGVGYCESSSVARGYVQFPTTMRSNPTVTSDQLEIRTITGLQRNINTPTFETNENGVYIDASNSGFTAGAGGLIRLENNAGKLEADAEL